MRISDWSSDVCSSDLDTDGDGNGELEVVAGRGERESRGALIVHPEPVPHPEGPGPHQREVGQQRQGDPGNIEGVSGDGVALEGEPDDDGEQQAVEDRKRVVWGKGVYECVDQGGGRIIKKKK